jgi:hypothetical protein
MKWHDVMETRNSNLILLLYYWLTALGKEIGTETRASLCLGELVILKERWCQGAGNTVLHGYKSQDP